MFKGSCSRTLGTRTKLQQCSKDKLPYMPRRYLSSCHRTRASRFFIPSGGVTLKDGQEGDTNALMIQAGFLRKAYGGIFHLLPLGLKVQDKLERLIDSHMQEIGASKVSLSTLSQQSLWQKSGRLGGTELFKFEDRRGSKWLLGPTHEEEITSLVKDMVNTPSQLPIRLYQTTRKFRDEPRPRQGLLRTKEFLMKDLYTFDATPTLAQESYRLVTTAYHRIFQALKIPYLVAAADSGDMGGSMSHEYHLPNAQGEDTVISCTQCDLVSNEELPTQSQHQYQEHVTADRDLPPSVWLGITHDQKALIRAHIPHSVKYANTSGAGAREFNVHAVKKAAKDLGYDLDLRVSTPKQKFLERPQEATGSTRLKVVDIFDRRVSPSVYKSPSEVLQDFKDSIHLPNISSESHCSAGDASFDLIQVQQGDPCPSCSSGTLKVDKTLELGHTFYLGTRYTKPLKAQYRDGKALIPIEMGCYGIGLSRIIAAIASHFVDAEGLNWPRVIAPFDAVVVATNEHLNADAEVIYDTLAGGNAAADSNLDVLLDDRDKNLAWKLNDADKIGYPIIVVLGKSWKESGMVEVQCRRLGVKEQVKQDGLLEFLGNILPRL